MRPVPFFLDTFPRSRRPDYSRQRGELRVAVAIVGGGLTGCACASAFATAGVRVAVLESDRIGAGATAASLGLLRQDFDGPFRASVDQHGLRTARHLWQSFRRASLDFAATIRRLDLRADLAPQDLLILSQPSFTGDATTKGNSLQREYRARHDAGLEGSWLTPRAVAAEAGLTGVAAVRTKGDALDPYRVCIGLAAAAASKGAQLHERTTARRIRAGRKSVEIETDGGRVIADTVIIATGGLPDDLKALRRHFAPTQAYAVVTESLPAAVRKELGKRASALRDASDPPHLLRWLKQDRVLFSGADQPPVPPRLREKTIGPRANRLMYELSTLYPAISGAQPEWAWDFIHHGSPDGLPVIGPHRNFPRHLFALGHGRHGAGVAWLAARVLLRDYLGEPATGDEAFGFARVL
jgi:glycine/D-amino acid oxidase-like deaminating enzyme